jgi:uridine kinase
MLIIGVAGGTGSGKTTVVQQIISELPENEVSVISQDSYYHELDDLSYDERCEVNFDHPSAIDFDLMTEHLAKLRSGDPIEQPVYSFEQHTRLERTQTVHPTPVLIVEGILVLAHPDLLEYFDLKLFVHADSDERLVRRLKRDVKERGRDFDEVVERYQNTLRPMHNEFIEPSKQHADLIIPTHKKNRVAVELIRDIIDRQLSKQS